MIGSSGHGMLSRVRSHRKLRAGSVSEEVEVRSHGHRRQHSDTTSASTTRRAASSHWPPLEWDPLKLNPPVQQAPAAPPRLHERQPLQTLRTKRSFTRPEVRRPARLHHSDSFTGAEYEGFNFNFKQDRSQALQIVGRDHQQASEAASGKSWPSPASSVDSNKSWFDYSDDEEDEDDVPAPRSDDIWDEAPSPRRRPQLGSPNDANYFIKRGAWKRKAIFFGGQAEDIVQADEDVFEV